METSVGKSGEFGERAEKTTPYMGEEDDKV